MAIPRLIENLIDDLSRLPGIGPKSAARIAFFLLHSNNDYVQDFSDNIKRVKAQIHFCKQCHNLTEHELCLICENDERDQNVMIVVEDVLDLLALEKIGDYNGLYHVLGGVISPLQGIGPDQINIASLVSRLEKKAITELILATNPNLEGEATAMYIKQELGDKHPEMKISRIARGLPSGADLDYADRLTLERALTGRTNF